MTLTTGTKLGRYEIVAPLGARGMGEVFPARDTRLDRTVAIKILPVSLLLLDDCSRVTVKPEVIPKLSLMRERLRGGGTGGGAIFPAMVNALSRPRSL
jgi:hypothetical protein